MSKATRAQEPLTSESTSEGKVSPLFAHVDPPIYADEIAEIRLYRMKKTDKIDLAAEEFYIDGDAEEIFEIDPYETTTQELQAQFGGGNFWIEAYRKPDGCIWKNSGRRLILAGPSKVTEDGTFQPKGREDDNEDEDEDDESETRPAREASSPQAYQVEAIRQDAEKRVKEAVENAAERIRQAEYNAAERIKEAKEERDKTVDMHQMFAATMMNLGKSNQDPTANEERIRVLRDENDSLRKRLNQDLDELRRQHREDMHKLQTQHEDAIREARRRAENELDDIRTRHRGQDDELRRRWTEDVQEVKSRYEQILTQLREERSAERTKLQSEIERDRSKYEEQVRGLQRENIDLEKKTNAAEAALEALQNAPSGGPNFMQYVVQLAATPVGQTLLGGVLSRAQAAAAAAASAEAGAMQAQQVAPEQQPAPQANPAPSPAPEQPTQQGPVFTPTNGAPTPWAPPTQQATPPPSASPAVDATRPVAASTTAGDPTANGVPHAPTPEATTVAQESAA